MLRCYKSASLPEALPTVNISSTCQPASFTERALYFRLNRLSPALCLHQSLSQSLCVSFSSSASSWFCQHRHLSFCRIIKHRQTSSLIGNRRRLEETRRGWGETLLSVYTISIGISCNSPENQ